MKRSGFSRPQIERKPLPAYRLVRACASGAPALGVAEPMWKFEYVRSKPLREACRLIPCQHCGADDGTVVAAHSNWAEHGKGKSIKASDIFVASLCHICHHQLDQGFLWSAEERKAIWTAAHKKTVALLNERGLWPDGVPQP